MSARRMLLFACLSFIILAYTRNASAHCEVAYSAGPAIAYKVRSKQIVESRTSINIAESNLAASLKNTNTGARPKSFATMTSSDVRAVIPPDVVQSEADNLVSRQKSLTYQLLYIRKLYEEEKFTSVLQELSELRSKGILRDADAQDGYDDGDVRTEAYFSIANLTRIFHAYEQPSKLAVFSAAGFGEEYRAALRGTIETQWVTFNFEVPKDPFSLQSLRNDFLPIVTQGALNPAAAFARAQASERPWDRITNLTKYNDIMGVSDDVKDQIDMYVNTGTVVGSLLINKLTGRLSLHAGLTCRNDFEQSLAKLSRALPPNENVALSALVKADNRYVLTIPRYGHIYITEEEFGRLMNGESVAGKDTAEMEGGFHRVITELIKTKRSLVLWSHPMMQKKGLPREANMRFAHALARAYPELNVVIDDPNPRVPELTRKIGELSIPPKDIFVVIDRQYSVKLQGELADEAAEVRKLVGVDNLVFFDGNEPDLTPSPRERAVIVITGHADDALEAFIDHLAEKGYLKNNLVVLQSCGNELSPRLVSKINNKYGAAGTFHYPENIKEMDAVTHTKEILRSVAAASVSGASGAAASGAFGRIVRDRAAKPSTPWQGAMDGVWTICQIPDMRLRRG